MATELLPAVLDVLRQRLALDGDLVAVWLFGSVARGEARPDSDVDVAFLARRSVPPLAVFDAAQDLAVTLGRDVDLVDLSQALTVFRAQVVTSGRRLFAADTTAADTFEMYALSDYARLSEERREVVARFEERYLG
jgi:predicted nucleotidyltransferase